MLGIHRVVWDSGVNPGRVLPFSTFSPVRHPPTGAKAGPGVRVCPRSLRDGRETNIVDGPILWTARCVRQRGGASQGGVKLELERAAGSTEPLDALAEDLQRLRNMAGDVSYAEIAVRIARKREEQGINPAAARVARSSVFDAFRTGRRRINTELVVEIALALGEDDTAAGLWRQRCLDARLTSRTSAATTAPDHPIAPVQAPAHPARALALIVVLLIGCVGVNLFGDTIVDKFQLPVWLDMIGTATAAIALGPWHGVLVGVLTNLLGGIQGNPETLPFLPVNVVGALVWGYGYRLFCANGSALRFILLTVAVAISCTLVAVPINVLVFGGVAGHVSDSVTSTLIATGEGLWVAVFSANVTLSLLDKMIAGGIALLVTRLLPPLGMDPRARGKPVV